MRDKNVTRDYYINKLGFTEIVQADYPEYLIVEKDQQQIHFFAFRDLDPRQNYGQVYIRTDNIDSLYHELRMNAKVAIHPGAPLQTKPWGQKEFSLLDPDNNLLTFGQGV